MAWGGTQFQGKFLLQQKETWNIRLPFKSYYSFCIPHPFKQWIPDSHYPVGEKRSFFIILFLLFPLSITLNLKLIFPITSFLLMCWPEMCVVLKQWPNKSGIHHVTFACNRKYWLSTLTNCWPVPLSCSSWDTAWPVELLQQIGVFICWSVLLLARICANALQSPFG